MEYGFEAFAILLAVLLPLAWVILFLQGLIEGLGDPSTITPIPDEEK